MPADYVLTTGHFIQITMNPPETYPTLTPPIPLVGSSTDMKVIKMPVCLEGDETPPLLRVPHIYFSPTYYTIPGWGLVDVKINATNKTSKTKNGGKLILRTGQTFNVDYNVTVPAIYVNEATGAPIPDPVMKKTGIARFINLNFMVRAD